MTKSRSAAAARLRGSSACSKSWMVRMFSPLRLPRKKAVCVGEMASCRAGCSLSASTRVNKR